MVKLLPACKGYLWGGEKLREQFHVQSDLNPLAEAWVLSAHPDGESVADGVPFSQYLQNAELGGKASRFADFPVLIKLIDAKQDLSVQVHPDDTYARQYENGNGKTEMWYVLSAEEGASLYYGFSRNVTEAEVRERIENGTLTDVLNRVSVKAGDVFFIEAGTVHAIGAGLVICEIQQNSNTTYRLYDYDRRDKDGNRRPLHIDKALAVSNLAPTPMKGGNGDTLAECPYFRVRRVRGAGQMQMTADSFHAVTAVAGTGTLTADGETVTFTQGDCFFIPAGDKTYTLAGDATVVVTDIP